MSIFNETKSPWYPLTSALTLPTYATCFQLSLQKSQSTSINNNASSYKPQQLNAFFIGVSHGPLDATIQNLLMQDSERGDFLTRNEERLRIRWVKTRKPCLTRQKEMVWSGIPEWNKRENKICEKCGGRKKRFASQNRSIDSSMNDSSVLSMENAAMDTRSNSSITTGSGTLTTVAHFPELNQLLNEGKAEGIFGVAVTTAEEETPGGTKALREWSRKVFNALQKIKSSKVTGEKASLLSGGSASRKRAVPNGNSSVKSPLTNKKRPASKKVSSGTLNSTTKSPAEELSLTRDEMDVLLFSRVFPAISTEQLEEAYTKEKITSDSSNDFEAFFSLLRTLSAHNQKNTPWLERLADRAAEKSSEDPSEEQMDSKTAQKGAVTSKQVQDALRHMGIGLPVTSVEKVISSVSKYLDSSIGKQKRGGGSSRSYSFDDFCRIVSRGKSQATAMIADSVDEHIEFLRSLFDHYDKEDTGFIPKTSAELFCKEFGFDVSQYQIDNLLEYMRTKGEMCTSDGFLTFAEFLSLLTGISKRRSIQTRACSLLDREKLKAFRRLFYRFDSTGNGAVSIGTLFSSLSSEWRYDVNETELKELLAHITFRKYPNMLQFEEFVQLMVKVEDKMDKYLQLFTAADTDGDGFISLDSLHNVLLKLQIPVTDSWMERFIRRVDPTLPYTEDLKINFEMFIALADMAKKFYFPPVLSHKQQVQFRRMFDEIDSTKDGYIDTGELAIIVQKLCQLDLVQEEVEEILFHFVKPHKQSEITLDEFMDFCQYIVDEISSMHEPSPQHKSFITDLQRDGVDSLMGVSPIRSVKQESQLQEPQGHYADDSYAQHQTVSLSSVESGAHDASQHAPPVDIEQERLGKLRKDRDGEDDQSEDDLHIEVHDASQDVIGDQSSAFLNITPPSIPPKHSSPFATPINISRESATLPQSGSQRKRSSLISTPTTPTTPTSTASSKAKRFTPQQEKRMKEIFELWDLDGDDFLDVHELAIGLKHRVPEDQLVNLVHQINKNLKRRETLVDESGKEIASSVEEKLDWQGFRLFWAVFKQKLPQD
uniref:EF-hand domain-containing protein n=1 Tax=Percolomonas cosmopolitus TaxID=63605 RepID=A0A7S1KTS6_9EUKA